MQDILKYNTRGNRKLIAMVIVIASIMLVLYTSDSTSLDTAIWGMVSIGGAFMGSNLIKHGMDRFGSNNNNQTIGYGEDAEY